jgi:hypothetical protein
LSCLHAEGGIPRAGVGEILRDHRGSLRLGPHQAKVVSSLIACRTGSLGGHLEHCRECGHRRVVYHSCRDRHCPRCGILDQALWAEVQEHNLIPAEQYFHVVFTIPKTLHPFFSRAPAAALDALFDAGAETLLEVGHDRLGARLGFTAVLHTWNQTMGRHPHLHCIVPGGGLSDDGTSWIACEENFLLPRDVLATVVRGKLLSKLEVAHDAGVFALPKGLGKDLLESASRRKWNVYLKRPLAGPQQVVQYVSRYTRKIAISNSRVLDYDGKTVRFLWRDRAHANRKRIMSLPGDEFTRRFVQHILPPRFVRIRHYGILSNRVRKESVALVHALITDNNVRPPQPRPHDDTRADACLRLFGKDPRCCPKCGQRTMVVDAVWMAGENPPMEAIILVRGP